MSVHPITAQSFAIIDREIGHHHWSPEEYAIVRRAIHATADFDLNPLFQFSTNAIAAGSDALRRGAAIVVDVRMVAVAVGGTLDRYGHAPPYCALDMAPPEVPLGQTRSAVGMSVLAQQYPTGIFVVGNAPTALLALTEAIAAGISQPSLVIGVPVGFVAVAEAKAALAALDVPQIQVRGRKGGSPVAAAIVNALFGLTYG
jgi:precorrin-8X/cobalt-precorrin-8 methylmutase